MPIQQVSSQNTSIKKQKKQCNAVVSPVSTNSTGDIIEISGKKKENKALKYTLIGVGALLGIVAIAKRKSILKLFRKPFDFVPESTNTTKVSKETKAGSNVSHSKNNVLADANSRENNTISSTVRDKETMTEPAVQEQSTRKNTRNKNTIQSGVSASIQNPKVTTTVKTAVNDVVEQAKSILKKANVPEFYFADLLPSINKNNIDALPKIMEISKKYDKTNDNGFIKEFLRIYSPKNKEAGLKLLDVVETTEQDFAGVKYLTIGDEELKAPFVHLEKYIKNANETNVEKLPEIIDAISKRREIKDLIYDQVVMNKIYNYTNSKNSDLIMKLISEKNHDTGKYKFSSAQFSNIITKLVEINDDNFYNILRKLFNAKDEGGKGAISAFQIAEVVKKVNKNNYKILEKMINPEVSKSPHLINRVCQIFTKLEDKNINAVEKALACCDKLKADNSIIEYVNDNDINILPVLLSTRQHENYDINAFMQIFKDIPNADKLFDTPEKIERFSKSFEWFSRFCTTNVENMFNVNGVKNLLVLKHTNPQKYEKMDEVVKLVQYNKIPLYMTKKLSAFGEFSPLVMSDIEKLQKGESIIPKFKKNTPLQAILNSTKLADVISVDNELLINNGDGLIPLKMTEETYLKLFPPVERFASSQGSIGNCRFISSGLNNSMINPRARINLYRMIEQDGKDIIVTIPRYENYPTRFLNCEIELPQNAKHIEGALGLKMIEQSFAKGKWQSEGRSSFNSLEEIMDSLKGGNNYKPFSKNDGFSVSLPNYKEQCCYWEPVEIPSFEETLSKYSDGKQYLLSAGTKSLDSNIEARLDAEYNLYSDHAYSISEVNPKEKTITVSNPWNTAEWVKMSWDKFKENFTQLYVEKIL